MSALKATTYRSATCVSCVPFLDALISKNIINDYVFSSSFIDVCFRYTYDPEDKNDLTMVKYCYRRLWESICLRRKKKSVIICQGNTIYYHILVDFCEVFQLLDICIPPAIKKNNKSIELVNSVKEICNLIDSLMTDPITASTNISYLEDICRLKQFDWKSTCDIRRTELIRRIAYDKRQITPIVIADEVVGNLLDDTDADRRGIVSFTTKTTTHNGCVNLLQSIGDVEITDVSFNTSSNDITVTCYIEGGLTAIQRDLLLETHDILK